MWARSARDLRSVHRDVPGADAARRFHAGAVSAALDAATLAGMIDRPDLVVLDLPSFVVVSAAAMHRCVDTTLEAAGGAPLAVVFGTLDRVLGAHVAHDPMVDERPGASAFLRRTASCGIPIVAVGRMSSSVLRAIVRRFDWDVFLASAPVADARNDETWRSALEVAQRRGVPAERTAFASYDGWELAAGAERGRMIPLQLGWTPRDSSIDGGRLFAVHR